MRVRIRSVILGEVAILEVVIKGDNPLLKSTIDRIEAAVGPIMRLEPPPAQLQREGAYEVVDGDFPPPVTPPTAAELRGGGPGKLSAALIIPTPASKPSATAIVPPQQPQGRRLTAAERLAEEGDD